MQYDKKKEAEVVTDRKDTDADRKDARVAEGVAGNKVPTGDSEEKRNQLEQIKHVAQMLQEQHALLKRLAESIQGTPK